MRNFTLLSVLISGITLTACSHVPTPQNIGMPNPASQYCLEQGGKLDIKKTDAGEVGMCTLGDGSQVEEWDFFRKNHTELK